MHTPAPISVSEYLALLNFALRTVPEGTVIEGEVVDFKISQGKWVNFDLKDERAEAKISCFMTVFQLKVPLASGMRVHVRGYSKIFERFGRLSLNVESVELVGEGALAKAYALLKEKLQAEGLFDSARKRSIPKIPQRIGLITSAEAAAYGDFLRILGNRWGGVTVVHAPVHVQGQYAVPEILQAFDAFNALPEGERPEVLVLTRGGGSLEDLHAFNSEEVARAVYRSSIPVVVAVGHERDESLCDFVADVRASTPSNAAEMVVPDRRDVARSVDMTASRIADRLDNVVHRTSMVVDRSIGVIEHAFSRLLPDVDIIVHRISRAFDRARETAQRRVAELERVLRSVDPAHVLAKGYAIVRHEGTIVKRALSLTPGAELHIQFAEGEIEGEVLRRAQQEKLL